mgnify:CR=1 FL=1
MAYKKSNANGQATMANSEPIVIASDQSAVPVSGTITANIGTVSTLATAAKQDTIIGHVDGLEASNSAIQTAVEILDNAIAGNEMQVDVVAALPAGNNNIGDVDVITLPAVHFQDIAITGCLLYTSDAADE